MALFELSLRFILQFVKRLAWTFHQNIALELVGAICLNERVTPGERSSLLAGRLRFSSAGACRPARTGFCRGPAASPKTVLLSGRDTGSRAGTPAPLVKGNAGRDPVVLG